MFCPRCAVQNLDDAKFCRGCGTNLETVALVLADKYQPVKTVSEQPYDSFQDWLETRRKSTNRIAKGFALLLSSLLFGVAMAVFSNAPDWILIWMCLTGWMAVGGIVFMVTGTATLLESRFMRRQLAKTSGGDLGTNELQPLADSVLLDDAMLPLRLRPQSSVTEHTTTRLVQPESTADRSN